MWEVLNESHDGTLSVDADTQETGPHRQPEQSRYGASSRWLLEVDPDGRVHALAPTRWTHTLATGSGGLSIPSPGSWPNSGWGVKDHLGSWSLGPWRWSTHPS